MEDDVREICTSLTCEAALKSEIGNTRIMIDSVEDIFKLESYIVEEYDSVLRALDEYRVNKVRCG